MSVQAQVLIDSAASVTLADACVIPVLVGTVTGTGNAIAAQVPLSQLATFFESGDAPVHITSANANAFSVGLTGATNPAFNVDSSTALQVAGLNVVGAVTGGTVAVVVTDSGAAASLTINAKGTGTIGIGSVSTGRVTITPVTTITGALTATGGVSSTTLATSALYTATLATGSQIVTTGWANGSAQADNGSIQLGTNASYHGRIGFDASVDTLFIDQTYNSAIAAIALRTRTLGTAVTHLQMTSGSGVTQGGAAGSVSSSTTFIKAVTAFTNAAATTILTATIPNATHRATIRVTVDGALGAGGAVGAGEAYGTITYDFIVGRFAGAATTMVASTAFGSAVSLSAGAATITITAAAGTLTGANNAEQTYTITATISRGSGSSDNHVAVVHATILNANATGVTIA